LAGRGGARATATATAKAKAKAKVEAKAKVKVKVKAKVKAETEADPCGMTARKARAKANTGVLPLRRAQGQDDGILGGADREKRGARSLLTAALGLGCVGWWGGLRGG
jgi:hypothetical protein